MCEGICLCICAPLSICAGFVADVCRIIGHTGFLSVGNVSTAMPSWRGGDHYKGGLRANVSWQSMSAKRGRASGTQKRPKVHGLFRRCTSSSYCEMFWTVWLRDTDPRSGNGAVESMLQAYVQVFSRGLPVYYRYQLSSNETTYVSTI